MRVVAVVWWCELEQLSQGKAAKIAGLNCAKFIPALTRYQFFPCKHTEADTVREVNQDALARIRSRPRVNPTELRLPDSTILIREERDR